MDIAIKYIFVNPRNKKYVNYLINNSQEFHTLRYEDMYIFICQYVSPPFTLKIRQLLFSFKKFFIDIDKQIIQELGIDEEKELKKIKEKIKDISPDKEYQKLKNKNNIDKQIQNYSNLNMDKIFNKILK